VPLLHAIGHRLTLALPTATKIKDTEGISLGHLLEEVEPLQPGTAKPMHKHHTDVRRVAPHEQRGLEALARVVADGEGLVFDILVLAEVLS
jgi:hypothetical protein